MTRKQRRMEQQRAQAEAGALEQELQETRLRLRRAYEAFDLVSDPDLVEAWIFEINAQQARYSYLLKRRKALEQNQTQGDEVRT